MRPDYPHKIFPDFRKHFFLLMETLAMDASEAASCKLWALGMNCPKSITGAEEQRRCRHARQQKMQRIAGAGKLQTINDQP